MAIIYLKFGNEEIDTNRTHLSYNLHSEKDGLSDYDFVKNRGNGIPCKNASVSVKILTG